MGTKKLETICEEAEFVEKNEETKDKQFDDFYDIKVNNNYTEAAELQTERDQAIRQMEPTLAQKMTSVSWRIAVDSFKKVTGSEKVKN